MIRSSAVAALLTTSAFTNAATRPNAAGGRYSNVSNCRPATGKASEVLCTRYEYRKTER
jgi:hypothetical protein